MGTKTSRYNSIFGGYFFRILLTFDKKKKSFLLFFSETGKSHIKRTKHKDPINEETKKRMQSSAIYRFNDR